MYAKPAVEITFMKKGGEVRRKIVTTAFPKGAGILSGPGR